MNIIKLGHCCMLIEESGLRILIDPGAYTTSQNELEKIDYVLYTHEHPDHFHEESLKLVTAKNPKIKIITNRGVQKKLSALSVEAELVEYGQNISLNGLLIEGFGQKHADIYKTVTPVDNTGYFIGKKFFFPGDCLFNPGRSIELLALPIAGPWMKLAEAIDYALELKPKIAFPVHDGMLKHLGSTHILPDNVLGSKGIKFVVPSETTPIQI